MFCEALGSGGTVLWSYQGNLYYTDPEATTRDGFSLTVPPASASFDRKNNVERIDIRPSELTGVASLRITVTPFALRANHRCKYSEPEACKGPAQDFALVVENGRENP